MADIDLYTVEVWKTIPQAPDYEVSCLGRVRRATAGKGTEPGRLITSHVMTGGHLKIKICVGVGKKKSFWVHRLVAESFVEKDSDEKTDACHNDGEPSNNVATNLRWDTHIGNMLDRHKHGTQPFGETHHSAKYSAQLIEYIRTSPESGYSLSKMLGINNSYINRIRSREERRNG